MPSRYYIVKGEIWDFPALVFYLSTRLLGNNSKGSVQSPFLQQYSIVLYFVILFFIYRWPNKSKPLLNYH